MGNGQFPYLVEPMTWADVPAVMPTLVFSENQAGLKSSASSIK